MHPKQIAIVMKPSFWLTIYMYKQYIKNQPTNTRLGDRSFSVAGPRILNSLPASLRQPDIEFGHFQ